MKIKSVLSSLILIMFVSCDSGNTVGTSLSGNQTTGTTFPSTGSTGTGGAASCTGTASDGYNDQVNNPAAPSPVALFQYEVNLAGTEGWIVGNSPVDNFPDVEQAVQVLSNDGPYYIRFKTLESVKPPAGEEFCPGRVTNAAWMEHYSKLQFNVYRHSFAVQFGPSMEVLNVVPLTGEGGIYLTTTELVSTNSCSNVIKVPPLTVGNIPAGYTAVTLFEIKTARSDAQHKYCQKVGNCADPDLYNPAYDVRPADCWRITVQVATNRTHFFKGSSRTDY